MKACLVFLGGAADRPHPALRGETPLRRARMPHALEVLRAGRLGSVRTAPAGRGAPQRRVRSIAYASGPGQPLRKPLR